MSTLHFKTNINCGGCIATVTPFLDAEPRIQKWEVNTTDPQKILTIATDMKSEEVVSLLARAGYKAEYITA